MRRGAVQGGTQVMRRGVWERRLPDHLQTSIRGVTGAPPQSHVATPR